MQQITDAVAGAASQAAALLPPRRGPLQPLCKLFADRGVMLVTLSSASGADRLRPPAHLPP